MTPSRFTKRQLVLSMPGFLFALIGVSAFGKDNYTAVLMLLWGLFMTPVFWVYIEVLLHRELNWKHKTLSFLAVLLLIAVVSPTETKSPSTAEESTLEAMVTEVVTTSEALPQNTPSVPTSQESVKEAMPENPTSGQRAEVVSVTDGDTLKVNLNGRVETIRVIGIDTPETVHPTEPVGCFGREASNKAKELLSGATVSVVTDPSQGTRDKYERYLAYITLENGSDFGEEMLRGGYAYEYTYAIPYEKQLTYKEAEVYARETGAGLWAKGECESVPAEEVVVVPVITTPAVDSSESCTIKGNISYSTGEKIYHVPGQENYTDTVIDTSKGESWFCTESEAVAAGWRKAKR